MPIGIGLGTAIAGVAAGGATAYAAHKSASSAGKAAELEAGASDKQLAFAQAQEAQRQANWEKTQQFNTDIFNRRMAALAPYTNMGGQATATLANLIGGPAAAAGVMRQPTPVTFPSMSPGSTTLNNLVGGQAGPAQLRPSPLVRTAPLGSPTMANFMGA